jgi:IS5 family transposase
MSTPDFLRSRLDAMIDLRHPLAVLANRMPWKSIEATLAPIFEGRAREGWASEEVDLLALRLNWRMRALALPGVRACRSG